MSPDDGNGGTLDGAGGAGGALDGERHGEGHGDGQLERVERE